jgi:hypothetical protein
MTEKTFIREITICEQISQFSNIHREICLTDYVSFGAKYELIFNGISLVTVVTKIHNVGIKISIFNDLLGGDVVLLDGLGIEREEEDNKKGGRILEGKVDGRLQEEKIGLHTFFFNFKLVCTKYFFGNQLLVYQEKKEER